MNPWYCSGRRSVCLALAAFSFLMLSVMPPGARSAQAETLVVATDTAFLPFEFKDNGKYVGFDMDLLDLVAKQMGVSYSLLPMDFSNIFANLTAGKVDMAIAGISITQERERSMDFSDPYFRSDISLVVAQGNTDIRRFGDLAGKQIGLKRGTDAVHYVSRTVPSAKISYFQNMDGGFPYLELVAGRLDALVHDTANVQYYTANKGKGLVKVVDTVVTGNNFYAMAFPKHSALTQRVNAALRETIKSGQYADIYRKWFGVAPDHERLTIH